MAKNRAQKAIKHPEMIFAAEIGTLAAKAGQMGLHSTARVLYAALQEVGWELAGKIERRSPSQNRGGR